MCQDYKLAKFRQYKYFARHGSAFFVDYNLAPSKMPLTVNKIKVR